MPRRRQDGSLDSGHYSGAITSQYRAGNRLDDRFRVSNFTDATYISGMTLERFWHRPDLHESEDPNIWYFLKYSPTINMVDNSCDHCVTRHHYLKLSCSMSRKVPTRYTDPTVLYNFKNPLGPHYTFDVIDEDMPPGRGSVSAVYARVARK